MKRKVLFVITLCAVFFLAGWTVQSGRTQWEYRSEYAPSGKKTNELVEDGQRSNFYVSRVSTFNSKSAHAQRRRHRSSSRGRRDRYYTNVEGRRVHSPVHSRTQPSGASAQCRNGSYSFSRH